MFTNKEEIEQLIGATGFAYISKGVMTDKYEYTDGGVSYIVRCYPGERSFLADAEFYYMQQFQKFRILAPRPVKYVKDGKTAVLVYEKLEGKPLSDVWELLNDDTKKSLCKQIVANYEAICGIECDGVGRMKAYGVFSHQKWSDFEVDIEQNVRKCIFDDSTCDQLDDFIEDWWTLSESINKESHQLVWSDFSRENIIVTDAGELVGFIDFEGLMSGNHLLGVGYLLAHEGKSDFCECIIRAGNYTAERFALDYYAQMRYLRILPYSHKTLPNGTIRDRLEDFLPYVGKQIKNMKLTDKMNNWYWLRKKLVVAVCVLACLFAFWGSFTKYDTVMQNGEVKIGIDSTIYQHISGDVPIWCEIGVDTMRVRKSMEVADKQELYALIERTPNNEAIVANYRCAVDKIAYTSSVNCRINLGPLILLTLCLVILGCSARTFFDYIGNVCYKNERQNMAKWWPWYIFRLFIGAPIAAFILTASRCAMFSSLFMTKDLNTYLVVSFLAGFAMMEFLEILRGVSKALFGKFNN